MDEPFSALDTTTRRKMQEFLISIFENGELKNTNPTIILITHDEREAAFLANNVVVMKGMTEKEPAGIKAILNIELGKRTQLTRRTQPFYNIVEYLENTI